jgi:uncharacterized protein (TIGR02147 family)
MRKPSIDVFCFADFRVYLQEFYSAAKRENPKFSQRYIQEKVGASSSGWFSDVIKGRIAITPHFLIRLIRLMDLKDEEAEYFETLVRYQQAGSAEEKDRHLEKLLGLKGVKVDVIGQGQFEFYRHWHHSAIRELLFFHAFREGEHAELAKKLDPPIRPAQARESLRLLLSLGLIQPDETGRLRPTSVLLKKDSAFKSLYLKGYLKKKMELGMQALERFPKEERDVSALTLSLSRRAFQSAKAEMECLRMKLLRLAEKEKKPEVVYQCNFQMFPVTR